MHLGKAVFVISRRQKVTPSQYSIFFKLFVFIG